MIHEVWDLDNTVYRKCIMALKDDMDCVILCISSYSKWNVCILLGSYTSAVRPNELIRSMCVHINTLSYTYQRWVICNYYHCPGDKKQSQSYGVIRFLECDYVCLLFNNINLFVLINYLGRGQMKPWFDSP